MYEVIETLASQAPPSRHGVDDIVAAGQRVERRQRASRLTAGVTVFAAIAVAAAVSLPHLTAGNASTGTGAGRSPTAAGNPAKLPFTAAQQPFTYTFKGYDAGGMHVQNPTVVTTAYQMAPILVDGHKGSPAASAPTTPAADGTPANSTKPPIPPMPPELKTARPPQDAVWGACLVLYRPGAFSPDTFTGSERVTIAGRTALLGKGMGITEQHRRLAWQYTDGAWASVEWNARGTEDLTIKELAGVVTGLAAASHVAARTPITLGYLPSGFKPVSVAMHTSDEHSGSVTDDSQYYSVLGSVRLGTASVPPTTGLHQPWLETDASTTGKKSGLEGSIPGSLKIIIYENKGSEDKHLSAGEKPPSEPKCYDYFCIVWSPDGKYKVEVIDEAKSLSATDATLETKALSKDEWTRIAKGVKFAELTTVHNDATWPDANTAFPAKP